MTSFLSIGHLKACGDLQVFPNLPLFPGFLILAVAHDPKILGQQKDLPFTKCPSKSILTPFLSCVILVKKNSSFSHQ